MGRNVHISIRKRYFDLFSWHNNETIYMACDYENFVQQVNA